MVDWMKVFTPIEREVWEVIRNYGLPFRPQYPVLRYFADFADPEQKIIIECDGSQFHKDKDRDARRDEELTAAGWAVFRIPGWQCLRPDVDWLSVLDMRESGEGECADALVDDWMTNSGGGVVLAIADHYYGYNSRLVSEQFILKTLSAHARRWSRA